MLPKFPIRTTFDPAQSDYARELWAIPAGRILMLLWRPSHLCSSSWFIDALPIARRIEKERPKTHQSLYMCFKPSINGMGDFTEADCAEFAEQAIDFFGGKRHVPYVGVVNGSTAMLRE